jgi:hypothetical protein
MNDTQSMARQRGGGPNQNYGSQRHGNPSGGPPSNNYNSYGAGGNSGNNYPTNSPMGGGIKREDWNEEIFFL